MMIDELKPCPFHNSHTCGCCDSLDAPPRVWNTRPLEDGLRGDIARLTAELAALRGQTLVVCHWTLVDNDSSHWAGECGAEWVFVDGSPEENEVAYCMKCGKRLEQLQPDPEDE